MLGGGEEYFAPPPPINVEVMRAFAQLGARLRRMEKAGQKAVAEVSAMAIDVAVRGSNQDDLTGYELVVGLLYRHIKSWTGQKQLAGWYVLDKLVKDRPSTFGHVANLYLLDVAREFIPWEDAALAPKYEALIDHWDKVFDSTVLISVRKSRAERLYSVAHPEETKRQYETEEKLWEEAEDDEQGTERAQLDDYGMPCMDYMQGRCIWGNECKLLHPPGLEGSMPEGTHLGDWKCPACGTINRHFRRRCQACMKERPQFSRAMQKSAEETQLTNPDTEIPPLFTKQFGFDPQNTDEAVNHWNNRLSGITPQQWRSQRRAAYLTRILKRPPSNAEEEYGAKTVNYSTVEVAEDGLAAARKRLEKAPTDNVAASSSASAAPQLPKAPAMPPRDLVFYAAQQMLDKGVHDKEFASMAYLLSRSLNEASGDSQFVATPLFVVVVNALKLVFNSWKRVAPGTPERAKHVAVPLFTDLTRLLGQIPFTDTQRAELSEMCEAIKKL